MAEVEYVGLETAAGLEASRIRGMVPGDRLLGARSSQDLGSGVVVMDLAVVFLEFDAEVPAPPTPLPTGDG